jgi:hypothetical protein
LTNSTGFRRGTELLALRGVIGIALCGALCSAGGCRTRAAAAPRPLPTTRRGAALTTAPSVQPIGPALAGSTALFQDRSSGFSLRYPAGWSMRQDPDNVFTADARAGDENGPELAVAVPKLPPHIPGMIPLGAVESGYLDDLKKRLSNVQVQQQPTARLPVPSNHARRFDATGNDKAGERKLAVLVLLKGDRLYILTAEAPAPEFARARAAFDQAVASWQWMTQ